MNIKRNIIFALESRKKNGCTNKLELTNFIMRHKFL